MHDKFNEHSITVMNEHYCLSVHRDLMDDFHAIVRKTGSQRNHIIGSKGQMLGTNGLKVGIGREALLQEEEWAVSN